MTMIETNDVAASVHALHDALETAYAGMPCRQADGLSVHTSVRKLDDRNAAIAHAKWTAKSLVQDVTDKCLISAAAGLLWLKEFLALNGLTTEARA